jgi:hypothetical protein
MRSTSALLSGVAFAALIALTPHAVLAQGKAQDTVTAGATDLGGVVSGPNGPEAGVWVIAETTDLPTKYSKIVVTDERGRYVIPELPRANYNVWVRGYGLVDSPKTRAMPGRTLNLTAVPAANAQTAAEYYPPIHWFAMLKVPEKSAFPLGRVQNQQSWLHTLKTGGCNACHALGTPGTRVVPKQFTAEFPTPTDAWTRRIQSGGAQLQMARDIGNLEPARAIELFADWTDRIAKGELPSTKPERPAGIERNVVVTQWDWGRETAYLHDAVSTDRRNPRLNANGKVYGSPENSTDFVPVVDPMTNTASEVKHPVRDPKTPSTKNDLFAPSAVWGDKPIWDSQTLMHNPMMDAKGRVWFTARVRPSANPAFCKQGSAHPSAKAFPLNASGRQLSYYDPKTDKFTLIDTCFSTHHLNFAHDALISSTRQLVDGRHALLLNVSQTAGGMTVHKWMIVSGDTTTTVMIVGTFPKELEPEIGGPMRDSLLTARWAAAAAPPDHFEGLSFRVSPTKSLKIAGRMSNMLMLTESGQMGPQGSTAGLLVVGTSLASVDISDLKAFAVTRASQTKQLTGIRVSEQGTTTIGSEAAYELVAEGTDIATGRPVTLYQVVVPDPQGYVLMQGMVASTRAAAMVPEFRKVARTFRRTAR